MVSVIVELFIDQWDNVLATSGGCYVTNIWFDAFVRRYVYSLPALSGVLGVVNV
jgi:hypothetical protein